MHARSGGLSDMLSGLRRWLSPWDFHFRKQRAYGDLIFLLDWMISHLPDVGEYYEAPPPGAASGYSPRLPSSPAIREARRLAPGLFS